MSLKAPTQHEPETELSEVRLATAYGIEGLKRGLETDEYDEWLDLFEVVLEELSKPWNQGRGNFPLKEFVIPEEEQRQEITRTLGEIDRIADDLQQTEVERRDELREEVEGAIDDAEDLYDSLEALEEHESSEPV